MKYEGIYHQVKNTEVVTLKNLSFDLVKQSIDDLYENLVQDIHKTDKQRQKRIKILKQKAKELGKEVPNYLFFAVWSGDPQGSWFFEKYKEWFE